MVSHQPRALLQCGHHGAPGPLAPQPGDGGRADSGGDGGGKGGGGDGGGGGHHGAT